ncbi:MAG: hypothetical protein IJZ53_07590 [Tyzzerella sp.]|nr:hypothetical protein [Tyzzerella sp.]
MKWPCLVLKQFCKTDIKLSMDHEGINEYGEPLEPVLYEGKCNYQDKAKRIFTDEKKVIEITGTALFPGDICPTLPVISGGTAIVHGVERRIYQGTKARNPDGSVNYTEVLLQ